jgi:signal transduction histidine kinase
LSSDGLEGGPREEGSDDGSLAELLEIEASEPGVPSRSLFARGAGFQFVLAIFLISVLPALTVVVLMLRDQSLTDSALVCFAAAILAVLALMSLGYVVLGRHVFTIRRLRCQMKEIAKTEMPAGVYVSDNFDDIAAIEKYLNLILFQTKWKIAMLERQRQALIDAERQRVMIESLGTACHHLGQPITAITVYLELMKKEEASEERRTMIEECLGAVESLRGVIGKLRTVSEYRTRS